MRSRFGRKRSVALSGLTPLVDTLFILLFSLLALSDTRRSHEQEEIRIQLPDVTPDDAAPTGGGESLVLEIDAESKVSLRGEPAGPEGVSRSDLDAALVRALTERGDLPPEEVVVEIHADRNARHGVAVELLQHLRTRGFVTIQLVASGNEDLGERFGAEAEDAP